jgi:hypothetical protein
MFSELEKATAWIFDMKCCLVHLYQDCFELNPWVKLLPAQGDIDLLSCPLMYSNEILTMRTVLVVKLNFDIR